MCARSRSVDQVAGKGFEAGADDLGKELAGRSISDRYYFKGSMCRAPGAGGGGGVPVGAKTARLLGRDS